MFGSDVIRVLSQAAASCYFFDDWLEMCEAIISPAVSYGAISPIEVYEIAYNLGIREARRPLYQARLDAITITNRLQTENWYIEAIAAVHEGDLKSAARLFVNNGWIKAPCCQGLVPCELHDAIRAEYCSRN